MPLKVIQRLIDVLSTRLKSTIEQSKRRPDTVGNAFMQDCLHQLKSKQATKLAEKGKGDEAACDTCRRVQRTCILMRDAETLVFLPGGDLEADSATEEFWQKTS
jgi:hypothetical protein